MVNPIFGIDVSGVQYLQERVEGTLPTGTYRFVAPELRAVHQEMYAPYPVSAIGSPDLADFLTAGRADSSTFMFDLTASGVAYLKDAINLGGASTSGAYWSHAYVGRVYSTEDAQVKYWRVSGARIDNIAVAPGLASWQVQVTVAHKPATITGAATTGIYFTEWPGAAADPVLNPHTVGSGTLFTFNGTPWYIATLGLQVNQGVSPVPLAGEQNVAKFNSTRRSIDFVVAPYDTDLETYSPFLNTVGTGVITFATGRTATLTGLYFYGINQLPFMPSRPATLGMAGAVRSINIAG